jgi:hypothetical protein
MTGRDILDYIMINECARIHLWIISIQILSGFFS